MPGNEFGDRLHNFFAQENFSQGQNQAQVLDGNWQALNNHAFGSQRSHSVQGPNTKSYNLQQPVDSGRGPDSHLLSGPHGMDFSQPSPRHEASKSLLQSQQQNYNDYMYGHLYRTQQEGKCLSVNTGTGQPDLVSIGTSGNGPQGLGREHQTHEIVKSKASESQGSFDLFGSQHQLSRHHQSNISQPQSGLNDMQQHVVLMRMQELQRQQQQNAMQQSNVNLTPLFSKATSSAHSSSFVNDTRSSVPHNPWGAAETSTVNWLQRSSPAFQGSSSNGLIFTNHSQGQHLMSLNPERSDQSLYGVPVSSSKAGATQYPQTMTDRTHIKQTNSFNNSFPGDNYFAAQDRTPTSKQKIQCENLFGNAHGESLNSMINMENHQRENVKQRSITAHEFQLRPQPISLERTAVKASSNNDVALDPTEEQILFGSDDNIWAAFGKSTNLKEEACNSVDGASLLNENPSFRGGTWSALMQSVAETSSTDVQPRDAWSGLNFHLTEVPSGNHNSSTRKNSGKQPNSFAEGRVPLSSSLNSETVHPSECTNVNNNSYDNIQGFQQSGQYKFPIKHDHGQRASSSQRPVQLSEEERKWLDGDLLQRTGNVHDDFLQPGRPSVVNAHVNSKIFSPAMSADESNPFPSTSSQINYWKNTNDVKFKGSEDFVGSQSSIARNNQIFNSFQPSSREVKALETENRVKQENSSDSYHTSTGSLRENALSDVSDSKPGKEMSTRKFQYHPMGNLNENVDTPHGVRKHTNEQARAQQNARFGQSMYSSQAQKSSVEMGKRQSFSGQRDGKGPAEAQPQSFFLSSGSNMSAHLNRFVDVQPPNVDSPSSPNMLQLLQKVDQSQEVGATMCQKGPEAENLNGSIPHLQRCHSSISQGYGLQLGPPSQNIPVKPHLVSSQSSLQPINSSSVSHSTIENGENSQAQVAPPSEVHSLPYSRGTVQGDLINNRSAVLGSGTNEVALNTMCGRASSAFSSGYIYPRSALENQEMDTGKTLANQSINSSLKHAPHFTKKDGCQVESSHGRSARIFSHDGIGTSQCANLATFTNTAKPTSFSEGVSTPQKPCSEVQNTVLVNSQAQQHPSSPQSRKELLQLPCSQELNIVESLSSALDSLGEDQDVKKGRTFLSKVGSNPEKMLSAVQGEIKSVKPLDVSTLMNSTASVHRDIEAFGQSLKPNKFSHHNYSLLNQMWATKNIETGQSNMMLKRMRTPDGQQISHASPQSADSSGVLSMSGSENNLERNGTDHQGTVSAEDLSVKQEQHTQFPQPWFDRYGTCKNGQSLAVHKAQRAAEVQATESPLTIEKTYNSLYANKSMDRIQHVNVGESLLLTSAPVENASSSQSLSVNITIDQQHSVPRPKKRTRVTADLVPWYKEVSEELQNRKSISGGALERDWAKETNRITEKAVKESRLGDGTPEHKARRRLFVTTHLMQQLFHPPPASFLLADSKSEFENVAYLVSKMALGSACGLVSCFIGYTSTDRADGDDKELPFDKCSRDQYFSKIVEEFEMRKRKLEDQLLKVESGESVLNLAVHSLDLEKFSMINRFAMFHCRLHNASSSSSEAAAAALIYKAVPHRYVTAVPIPEDLPTEVKCLSL
ncbi:unnamed protein product [Cuscuta campestris]|uniref:Uncharacterized protein n=1 Tax=Cuscuta campestris TaxID=132261 RepID=A0A484MEY4_9ASTE|nr:unnamed protein product [Cuscuta campestris]